MHRKIIAIKGEQQACLQSANALTRNLFTVSVSDIKKAKKFLGQEFDAVIYDLHETFDANGFGAITGTIRGGGVLVLLLPAKVSGKNADSRFMQRFNNILLNNPIVHLIEAGDVVAPLKVPQKASLEATPDQNKAVDAIIHVVKGHRRRPLLITSDRGRGKSAALGIAACRLLQSGYQHICVCAPSKKTAEVVFKHAGEQTEKPTKKHSQLHFYAPDELLQKKPETDLLLIDEAAAIPLKILKQLLQHYPRIVFSTTEHGYEGSGRGFATRFRKILDEQTPGWQQCKLEAPIRWAQNDPLEQITFSALLMDAEPVDGKEVANTSLSKCEISRLNRNNLLDSEQQLNNLFGLLVAAHYQTRPSDLQYMLDDKSVRVYAIKTKEHIVATALVATEGGFDEQMASQIFQGTRRPKGNLVAQGLAANAGIENAPCLIGDRVVRIAVHPDLQGNGFGTALLKFINNKSDADYVSSSFGATPELLTFWKQSGFTAVNVGIKRDASSGSHSVIMLKPNSKQGEGLVRQAQQRFCKHFPHMLTDPLADLEADLVFQLFCSDKSLQITETEKKEITAFALQLRAYENSMYPVWKLVCKYFASTSGLAKDEREILVLKVLQKHSWQQIVAKMSPRLSGKKQALALLRKAVFALSRQ